MTTETESATALAARLREKVAAAICCPEGCLREDDCWRTATVGPSCRRHKERVDAAMVVILDALDAAHARVRELEKLLNTPELHDFSAGVTSEAQHQRARWGSDHDAGKKPEDWFWLVGYLAGKALAASKDGNVDKALHHCVSTAAALANWHAALSGTHNRMRPGIDDTALKAQP